MHSSVSITPSTDAGNTNAAAAYLSRATSSPGFTGLAAGNPFADAGLTSLGTFLRGGKGDDNDSDDIQSDTVSSATGAIGKVKGKGRPLSNPRSDLIPKDATSTTNTGSTGPISSKKPKKRKLKSSNKRKPQRAQIPASSAGASAAAVANAPLPSFDVADFLARRASQDAAIKAELQRCEQRHEQLLGMLACWLEVAKTREWERADARLRTRMAKLRQEEEGLRAKEEHREFWCFLLLLYLFVWARVLGVPRDDERYWLSGVSQRMANVGGYRGPGRRRVQGGPWHAWRRRRQRE